MNRQLNPEGPTHCDETMTEHYPNLFIRLSATAKIPAKSRTSCNFPSHRKNAYDCEQSSVFFDRFHIMKKMNEAVDKIRREEQGKSKATFKKTRYWWLYNSEKLKDFQRERIEQLGAAYPTIR